jgi:hypothetical protein
VVVELTLLSAPTSLMNRLRLTGTVQARLEFALPTGQPTAELGCRNKGMAEHIAFV